MTDGDMREVFETILPEDVLMSAVRAAGFQERERKSDGMVFPRTMIIAASTGYGGRQAYASLELLQRCERQRVHFVIRLMENWNPGCARRCPWPAPPTILVLTRCSSRPHSGKLAVQCSRNRLHLLLSFGVDQAAIRITAPEKCRNRFARTGLSTPPRGVPSARFTRVPSASCIGALSRRGVQYRPMVILRAGAPRGAAPLRHDARSVGEAETPNVRAWLFEQYVKRSPHLFIHWERGVADTFA